MKANASSSFLLFIALEVCTPVKTLNLTNALVGLNHKAFVFIINENIYILYMHIFSWFLSETC